MLLSVRIYTHPRGDEMDEEGGELIRALSPITNKEQKSMTGSEPCAKREELGLSRKQLAERLNIHEFEIAE
jgi:DNA-binding transcriptional regulator YiaG